MLAGVVTSSSDMTNRPARRRPSRGRTRGDFSRILHAGKGGDFGGEDLHDLISEVRRRIFGNIRLGFTASLQTPSPGPGPGWKAVKRAAVGSAAGFDGLGEGEGDLEAEELRVAGDAGESGGEATEDFAGGVVRGLIGVLAGEFRGACRRRCSRWRLLRRSTADFRRRFGGR